MANSDETTQKHPPPVEAPPANFSTSAASVMEADVERGAAGFGVPEILRRWRREDLLKRLALAFRVLGLLFSFIASIVMASNKHGDWKDFDKYEEYRYLLAISILSTLYTGAQSVRYVRELITENLMLLGQTSAKVDFFGDQIISYLLISSASSAIPLTNRMREGSDNIFTDTSALAISTSIFAFIVLALSALISGYKLSTQSYF